MAMGRPLVIDPGRVTTGVLVGGRDRERPIEPDAFIDLVATQAAISYACLVFLVGGGVTARSRSFGTESLVSLPMYDRTSCSARPAASAARSSSRRSARRS